MDENPSFLRNPRWQIILAAVVGFIIYLILTLRLEPSAANVLASVEDVILCVGGFVFWFFFFSQFVLPVRRLSERRMVYNRLNRYLWKSHGPAVFIVNGEVKQHGREMQKRGPGIALIDAASAAMLRTDVRFTRAVGPGVVFTGYNQWADSDFEYVSSPVDLHYNIETLGPAVKEDPFDEKKKEDEPQEVLDKRQERRWQTSGLSRDGIEIVPEISVFYKLDVPPRAKDASFVYDENAVLLACTGEGIDPNLSPGEDPRSVSWNRLPGLLAVDTWREVVARFTLEDLFRELPYDPQYKGDKFWNKPGGGRYTGLEFASHYINQLMTQPRADRMDAWGRIIPEKGLLGQVESSRIQSQPFLRLKERGVRVDRVIISTLHLRKEIEDQLEFQWESTWLQRAQAERELLDQQSGEIRELSRIKAIREYASAAVQYLHRLPPGIARSEAEVLKALVEGTLAMLMHDGLLRKRAPNEKNQMIELLEWLQKKT